MQADRDQARDVRDVADHHRARLLGNLAQLHEIERARIGGGAAEHHARLDVLGQLAGRGEIDLLRLRVEAVMVDLEELAGEVDRRPVGEMAALGEREREDSIARPQQGEVRRHVRLRSGVRLDVGVLGAEERLGPIDGELLDLVDHLAAAVVALSRQALGVLVGERRAGRLEHRLGDEVLAGDELEAVRLPFGFLPDERGDLGVGLRERHFERRRHRPPLRESVGVRFPITIERGQSVKRSSARTALVPPKPKELESAASNRISRGWFGT